MKTRRGPYEIQAVQLRPGLKKRSCWALLLVVMVAWLVLPATGAAALEPPLDEVIVVPEPSELPVPLPEDPVQEVIDTVTGIINPPPEEQPPPSEDSGSGTNQDQGSGSTSDPNPGGGTAGTTGSGSTTSDSGSITSHVNLETRTDVVVDGTAGPSVQDPSIGVTSLTTPMGSAAFPEYENARGTLGPFEYANSRSSGPRSTVDVLAMLADLNLSTEQLARILAPFPVAGTATYSNDWEQPRFNPSFHLHKGTDIFAERGTPVIASADGVATDVTPFSEVPGTSLKVKTKDDTYYFYAHLDQLSPFVFEGKSVSKGEIIGYVGTSGNAEGGRPHLHYEIHPYGGPAVPPVPYLDRWLSEALQAAQALRAHPGQSSFLGKLAQAGEAVARIADSVVVEPFRKVANVSTATGWGSVLVTIVVWRLLMRRRRATPPSWLDVPGP